MTTTATITKTDTSKFEAALAACDAHNEPGVLASLYEAARAARGAYADRYAPASASYEMHEADAAVRAWHAREDELARAVWAEAEALGLRTVGMARPSIEWLAAD
jgi:hypothetical protein